MKSIRLSSIVLTAGLLAATSAHAQLSGLLNTAKKQLGAAAQAPAATTAGAAPGRSAPVAVAGGANSVGEMVLTKKRPTNFADAKANAAKEFNDGDDVWMAMHLNQPIKSYAKVSLKAGAPELYTIFIEIRRDDQVRAAKTCEWNLTPGEGDSADLILAFSPVSAREMPSGSFSLESKTSCFLDAVAQEDQEAGRWNYKMGLLKVEGEFLRADKAILAAPFVANIPNGFPLWNKIQRNAGGACDPRTQAKGTAIILCKK